MTYTVIFRRYVDAHIGSSLFKDFPSLEEACDFGDAEFANEENFDCYLRLPSGRVMAFTRMFGLV